MASGDGNGCDGDACGIGQRGERRMSQSKIVHFLMVKYSPVSPTFRSCCRCHCGACYTLATLWLHSACHATQQLDGILILKRCLCLALCFLAACDSFRRADRRAGRAVVHVFQGILQRKIDPPKARFRYVNYSFDIK